ncbi:hypothetical protein OSI21_15220 [Streptomyces libani]|nr:hypothetical protein [Streptomyces libani]
MKTRSDRPGGPEGPPAVGTLLHDSRTGKVGEFRGAVGGMWQLRPPGGGKEWDADPQLVEPAGAADRIRALALEHNARCRSGRR